MLVLKERQTGFTMMELLTVLVIISLLLGILIPSMNTIRKAAKNAKQKAQFAAISIALTAFKGDDGDYPDSEQSAGDYGGAQKLAEAIVGWDLMGFHPDSTWDSGGGAYDADDPCNLDARMGFYIDRDKAGAHWLGDDIGDSGRPGLFKVTGPLSDRFVICDSFGRRNLLIGGKAVRAGSPILYYKADPSQKAVDYTDLFASDSGTYDYRDNYDIVRLGKVTSDGVNDGTPADDHPNYTANPDAPAVGEITSFYYYIADRVATEASTTLGMGGSIWRSHNPDTYILISAGADGEYGTADDITNFGD
ncbi:MAG: prepilin-type N-terminal cleavage/methylation domain-containing protein [Planctomycetes bacterium]|nr:prepilin-type N-terminal cleavage/methylation domain-containing protein [Planctomycetota bacterium]